MSIGLFQSITEARARDRRSLLDQRRRQEDESFGDKLKASITGKISDSLSSAFEGAVEDIIQTPFKRNIEDFENREDLRRKQTQVTTARNQKKELDKIYNAATSYEGSEDDYWLQKMIDEQREFINVQYTNAGKNPNNYSESIALMAKDRANATVQHGDQSSPLWKRGKDLFYEAYGQAEDIPEGEFSQVVARNNKRASNIVEAAGKGITRLFSGKSKEDLDNEALQAIENSPLYKESQEFRNAFDIYRMVGRGNLNDFEDNLKKAKLNKRLDRTVPEVQTSFDRNNNLRVTETQYKVNEFGDKIQLYYDPDTDEFVKEKTNDQGNNLLPFRLIEGDTGFDFAKRSNLVSTAQAYSFNKEGMRELAKRHKALDINYLSPKNDEEYEQIFNMIFDIATNEQYLSKESPSFEERGQMEAKQKVINDLYDDASEKLQLINQVKSRGGTPSVDQLARFDAAVKKLEETQNQYNLVLYNIQEVFVESRNR